jgi:hypothetical protein
MLDLLCQNHTLTEVASILANQTSGILLQDPESKLKLCKWLMELDRCRHSIYAASAALQSADLFGGNKT